MLLMQGNNVCTNHTVHYCGDLQSGQLNTIYRQHNYTATVKYLIAVNHYEQF